MKQREVRLVDSVSSRQSGFLSDAHCLASLSIRSVVGKPDTADFSAVWRHEAYFLVTARLGQLRLSASCLAPLIVSLAACVTFRHVFWCQESVLLMLTKPYHFFFLLPQVFFSNTNSFLTARKKILVPRKEILAAREIVLSLSNIFACKHCFSWHKNFLLQ